MKREVSNTVEVILGDVYLLYLTDEKESADGSVSDNTSCVEITEEGDKKGSMDVWPDYSKYTRLRRIRIEICLRFLLSPLFCYDWINLF